MQQKIRQGILAAVCTLFLISGAVTVTLAFRPLYYFDIHYLKMEESSGYSEKEIRQNYDELISYNLSPFHKNLEFPTLPMSEEGRIHFKEVKNIFQIFLKMLLVTAVFGTAGAVYCIRRREYGFLRLTGIFTLVLPLGLAVLIAWNWQRVFIGFHELVFSNDYWLFDPATDPVINILPDTFFMHCAVLILVLVILGALICLRQGNRLAKHKG